MSAQLAHTYKARLFSRSIQPTESINASSAIHVVSNLTASGWASSTFNSRTLVSFKLAGSAGRKGKAKAGRGDALGT